MSIFNDALHAVEHEAKKVSDGVVQIGEAAAAGKIVETITTVVTTGEEVAVVAEEVAAVAAIV